MDMIPELRALDDDVLTQLGMYAENYVNDDGEWQSPSMDPFAERDFERFERFFEDESDDDDAASIASTESSVGDFTGIVTVQAGAEDENTEISAETVGENELVSVGSFNNVEDAVIEGTSTDSVQSNEAAFVEEITATAKENSEV